MRNQIPQTDEELKVYFDKIHIGLTFLDSHGNVTDCNKTSENLLQIPKAQQLERSTQANDWHIVDISMSKLTWAKCWRTLNKSNNGKNSIFGIRHNTANVTWLSVRTIAIRRERSIVSYVGVTEEIEKLRQAHITEERFKYALEGANDGVWDWNLLTDEVYFSPRLKSMLGYSDSNFANVLKSWMDIVHPKDLPKCLKAIKKHIEGKSSNLNTKYRMRCKNGDYKWILDRGKITNYDENGKPLRMIGTHTDITKMVELEVQLKKEIASKDTFISVLAHDLRNPFHQLVGFTGLLLENYTRYTPEKMHKYLLHVYKAASQTYDMLDDLLLWSKSLSGKMSLTPQAVNLDEICQQVVANLAEVASIKNISIEYKNADNVQLWSDSGMLKVILRNLLSNAIKFSNRESIVTLSHVVTNTNICITVSDKGVGIRPTVLQNIWNPYNRKLSTGTDGETGTGLGLLLCKELVEKHGGKIWVESTVDKGTDFHFTLPLYFE